MTNPTETPPPTAPAPATPTTLVIDIGGTGLKASVLDSGGVMLTDRVRIPTTYPCPPDQLVAQLNQLVRPLPTFDRVSVGFPGVVRLGVILSAPHFITIHGPGTPIDQKLIATWKGFDLGTALTRSFGRPVRIINDADLQGLDVITGTGVEVVITLGTGLGFSVFENGHLGPHLELAQHPFRKGETYNEQVGDAARKKIGNRRWNKRIRRVIATLDALVFFNHLYIGGGNARHLTSKLGPNVTVIDPDAGILGGLKLWNPPVR
jgi:polyphosphate glucokinase